MKRFLIGIFAALLSVAASATTFTPIQLLNPAGSSAGQAIISTGPTTVAAWGSIPATALTGILPVLNGGTGVTTKTGTGSVVLGTSPTIATPVISGGTIDNTCVGCTTPANAAFTTVLMSNHFTPSTTFGIVGTSAADNANAGSVGEIITSTASGVALSSTVNANVTSISLTAGDWDVQGTVQITGASGTTASNTLGGVSTTSATFGSVGSYWQDGTSLSASFVVAFPTPTVRINVATTTTVFLVVDAQFAVSTASASGFIRARRIR